MYLLIFFLIYISVVVTRGLHQNHVSLGMNMNQIYEHQTLYLSSLNLVLQDEKDKEEEKLILYYVFYNFSNSIFLFRTGNCNLCSFLASHFFFDLEELQHGDQQ